MEKLFSILCEFEFTKAHLLSSSSSSEVIAFADSRLGLSTEIESLGERAGEVAGGPFAVDEEEDDDGGDNVVDGPTPSTNFS